MAVFQAEHGDDLLGTKKKKQAHLDYWGVRFRNWIELDRSSFRNDLAKSHKMPELWKTFLHNTGFFQLS